ncbi:MAG: citrate synthase/methylcitrate synthase [Chloroflexi bacterium]|nr:citrate synthase/methylcitrate synthase [Chloroflexota bacterium]MCI0576354.1 citrate synthase/methylcitrate synthase [Chloroflexota bacterium]MCI0646187.1 citrate synthase/methylcitrate synthase [Chloroflexota bacterium]
MTTNHYYPGLEGVVAAETRLSHVDGQKGILIIAGFPVEELADKATFEEATYLLWHDALPTAGQLQEFQQALAARRALPPATLALLREAAVAQVPVMDALRMAAGTLNLNVPATGGDPAHDQALALLARFPTIAAAYWRLRQGHAPIPPHEKLGTAANFLYMLSGEEPAAAAVRGLETYLNTVIDHSLNASTFTARVIISTRSDLVSAIVGAIGALKGPLHGGAPGPALDMVFEIGSAGRAEAYLRAKLERGERLMGFGHRVYKVRDPRATLLAAAAEKVYTAGGDMTLYNLVRAVEEKAVALLEEYKPGRNLKTNVEFYTALLLYGLGLDTELFSPTFAVGRVAGWIAHCFEQQAANRLIRPSSAYRGVWDRRWVPLGQR